MKEADVHRTQISKYERGESIPELEGLLKLAGALGVRTDDLLDGNKWQRRA